MKHIIDDLNLGRLAVMAFEVISQKKITTDKISGRFSVDDLIARNAAGRQHLNAALQYLTSRGIISNPEPNDYRFSAHVREIFQRTPSVITPNGQLPSFILRHPVAEDLAQLTVLDQLTQPAGLHAAAGELLRRITSTPQTILLIEIAGEIAAALYSQRIDDPQALYSTDYARCTDLQRPDGRHIQLLGLYVLSAMTARGYSDILLEAMLLYARLLGSVQTVVGVTRCADYARHRHDFSQEAWIQQQNAGGEWRDAMLHFHTSHGAKICNLLPGFRPGDRDNDGAGVLIQYQTDRLYATTGQAPTTEPARIKGPVDEIVLSTLRQVLGAARAEAGERPISFLEMGLSSLELLEFRRRLNAATGLALDSTFFFTHHSVDAVCAYLNGLQVQEQQQEMGPQEPPTESPEDAIAIVGMACRFPEGLDTPQDYWQALLQGRVVTGPLPRERQALRTSGSPPFGWQGGFLRDIDRFDAAFFRISPREAEWLDPQQRLLLEVTWQALEDAGIAPERERGAENGIFIGLMGSDYAALSAQTTPHSIDAQFATGGACSVAAGRLAWFLDWRGPALTLDTACSSSLVAIHQACRSLLSGECRLALAAGANVLLDDRLFMAFDRSGMLSPGGRCHTFDQAADGYVRAEGCAAVVLKRLADAEAEGDCILAVLRGSAVNQDGASASLTAPNPVAQRAVIDAALRAAGVEGASIDYLEAHGTGTPLGDPIEVQAAMQALGAGRRPERPLLIGSAKNSLGHLEAAAGLAGLIKTVLSIRHGVIPAQASFAQHNAHIPWQTLAVQVVTETRPWPEGVRRAGVSSFGFSGTNCHVIVEGYRNRPCQPSAGAEPCAVVLSARTPEQLRARAQQLRLFLQQQAVELAALAWTLQNGRDAMAHRLGFVATSQPEAIDKLEAWLADPAAAAAVCCGAVGQHERRTFNGTSLSDRVAGWVNGDECDWLSLYKPSPPVRLALPTYPFAGDRFWLPGRAEAQPAGREEVLVRVPHWQPEAEENRLAVPVNGSTVWLSDDTQSLPLVDGICAIRYMPHDTVDDVALRLQCVPEWLQVVWQVPAQEHNATVMGFRLIKALLSLGYAQRALHLTVMTRQAQAVLPEEVVDPHHAAVQGLMNTLASEYPHWQVQVLDLPAAPQQACTLWQQRPQPGGACAQAWRQGNWYRQQLLPVPTPFTSQTVGGWRDGGIYVVVGGAGGIGVALSDYLIGRYRAQLVWLGRRPENDEIRDQRTRLAAAGPMPLYLQADAGDPLALQRAGEAIRERFGVIHGVIHATMDLADGMLGQTDEMTFRRGVDAKLTAQHLPALCGDQPLELMLFFSSVTRFLPVSGAGNYTAGCCFADACAHNLRLRGYPVKVINWGYWGECGACTTPEYQALMAQTGLAPMRTQEAMTIIEQWLVQPQPQVLYARTCGDRVMSMLSEETVTPVAEALSAAPSGAGATDRSATDSVDLLAHLQADLVDQAQQLLKLPPGRIEATVNLNQYGFDSIMLMMYARQLGQRYGIELSPALFFNHTDLQQFAGYLQQFFGPQIADFFQPDPASRSETVKTASADPRAGGVPTPRPAAAADEAIAIVGLSGRFAGARDADALWQILAEGRSVVSDFPVSRLTPAVESRPRWLAAAPGIDEFEPLFFEISPKDAALIDPRQRLLLQEGWRALEDAACGEDHLRERNVSLFVGVEAGDYGQLIAGKNTLTANHEAILASRLAYALNLGGGAQAINTACSSSLVALHQACQSLRSGECDTAMAAGVNLLAGTQLWDQMAEAGMLADDGVCRAFDQRGSGMVPGEAAVAVVLRRLSDALADGDPIRAVIVGSGINYDGKTQGITAPGGKAQSSLLRNLYSRYGLNPEQLEYLIAHGTGTPLGDPVEINALCEAFAPFTQRRQFCAITSNKPNVGHTLAASGLVSLVNMVLALEHETIPASINAEQLSHWINWPQSPFYLNTAARPWPASTAAARVGAVSAFGMSGTNAHVVVKGAEGVPRAAEPAAFAWTLLALSARTEAALRQQVQALMVTLRAGSWDRSALQKMSYSLLGGRHHFNWRLTVVIGGRDEALVALQQQLDSLPGGASGYAQLPREAATDPGRLAAGIALLAKTGNGYSSETMKQALLQLADLWREGYRLPWAMWYGERPPQRLSLPTYPFARSRYWAIEGSAAEPRHPLLHRDSSSAERQRYSTWLNGDEPVLRDHQVAGQPLLPGVAHLEWARAAAQEKLGAEVALRLEQVSWLRPLGVEEPRQVHLSLQPEEDGRLAFTLCGDESQGAPVYSQGWVQPLPATRSAAPRHDMAALRQRCTTSVSPEAFRQRFIDAGLAYGAGFCLASEVLLGNEMATGRVTRSAEDDYASWGFPAGVLDSALQIATLLSPAQGLNLPFALASIEQWGPLPSDAAVVARHSADSSEAMPKIDVDIVDDNGLVVLRLRGFSTRVMPASKENTLMENPLNNPTEDELTLVPGWRAVATEPGAAPATATDVMVVHWPTVGGDEPLPEVLDALQPGTHLLWYVPEQVAHCALKGLVLIKALLARGFDRQPLRLTIVTRQALAMAAQQPVDAESAGLHGLMGSLTKQLAHWQVTLLDLPPSAGVAEQELLAQPAHAGGNARRWQAGSWYQPQLSGCSLPAVTVSPYRQGGVYVIVGGAGGLGIAFSEHLLLQCRAQVIWLGRRQEDDAITDARTRLARLGPMPLYLQADATDPAALRRAEAEIVQRFGPPAGIVHSALVLDDCGVAAMDERRFETAFASKAVTLQVVDEVLGHHPLDFVLIFGALQSFLKAPGQGNYAAGCCFADAFAHGMARRRPYPVKVMNWGYWGSVGAVATADYQQRMAQMGMGSIDPGPAMAVLDRLLASPVPQAAYLKTNHLALPPSLAVATDWLAEARAPAGQTAAGLPVSAQPATIAVALAAFEQRLGSLLWSRLRTLPPLAGGLSLVAPRHQRWLDACLRLLVAAGVNTTDNTRWADSWSQWLQYGQAQQGDPLIGARIRLTDTVIQALPGVLRDEVNATEVLFPQGRLDALAAVYGNNPQADLYNDLLGDRLEAWLRTRVAEGGEAKVRILEIGAGTGGTSSRLFSRLRGYVGQIEEYCYTDLSRTFLAHGMATFAAQAPYLRTQLLDIERSPVEQGFTPGGYDIVVATNVLHATRNMRSTLNNTQLLLKEKGLLLLNEISCVNLFQHLIFGLLDGWWRAEDGELRLPDSPALSGDCWREVLVASGFSAVQISQPAGTDLGQQIIEAVSLGGAVSDDPRNRVAEVGITSVNPASGPTERQRLLQTLRACVMASLALSDSELEDDRAFSSYGVDSISSVALVSAINKRLELRLPATLLYDYPNLNRLTDYLHDQMGQRQKPQTAAPPEPPVPQPESPPSTPASAGDASDEPAQVQGPRWRRLVLDGPGAVEDIRLQDQPAGVPGPDEVCIEVQAFSLNFADLLCVKGLYPTQPAYPFTPGSEASGIVIAAGAEVRRVTVGDRVVVLTGETLGAHATRLICPQERVFPCPTGLSFTDACALPSVAITVLECFARAGLKAGERVLIQTATGGVGLMAIQLAQHLGAEIYATAGSQPKLDYLRDLGIDHAIDYRQEDFAAAIQRLTHGEGVDVILNTLAGDAMQKSLGCLRAGGRYVDIAMTALKSACAIDLSGLNNNQSLHYVDIRRLGLQHPEILDQHLNSLNGLLAEGALRPLPVKVFPFDDVHEAYRWLAGRQHIGKVVVSLSAATAQPEPPPVSAPGDAPDAIAVVGMSGRFARADSLPRLWQSLIAGEDMVEDATRWPDAELSPPAAGSSCSRGGFLPLIDSFDPLFFDISGREAALMDPQQRLFLEEAWHALEDAGYAGISAQDQRWGVFVGCAAGDYLPLLGEAPPAQAFWGNSAAAIPARIAFHLNWHGPVLAIDTACSSSLVAIHQACQSLRSGEADMAIAGGVFVQCTPQLFRQANQAGMLSNLGQCSTFDNRADGFVPGEGVGALVLKRLSQAQADGDTVYGVVRGSGVNFDGATNGITAPNGPAQTQLMRDVWARYGIDPAAVQLVEAHGTGTILGDPIELNALSAAFGPQLPRGGCAIGSVKSNIGHSATAAGIAGVMKVLLALEHRQIPPSIHFRQANRHIDFANSPFFVATQAMEWPDTAGRERLATVSSFGFSGTNAHLVIGEAPPVAIASSARTAQLIVVSAHSVGQVQERVKALVARVDSGPVDLGAMSFTLLTGRRHHAHRLACVATDPLMLREQLSQWLNGQQPASVVSGEVNPDAIPSADFGQALIESCQSVLSPRGLNEALSGLAALYVQGAALAWERLADGASRRRIRLPGYPFARQRYGVAPAGTPMADNASASAGRPAIEMPSVPKTAGITRAQQQGAPLPDVREAVREIFMQALALSDQQLNDDADFARYGIDSLVRMGLVRSLNEYFGLTLSLAVLNDYSTVSRLCQRIAFGGEAPPPLPAASPVSEPTTDDVIYLAGTHARKSDVESLWQALFNSQ